MERDKKENQKRERQITENKGKIIVEEPTNVPLEKDDLLAQAALIILELKIVHSPATFGLRQIFEEFIIVAGLRFFYWDNLRLHVVEPEDDILGPLPKFQRFIRSQTIWVCGYAGRLVRKSNYIGIF